MQAELGVALTVLRIVRGWSQEELAKASGVRSGSISDYERGRMVPGLKTLQRLVGAMGYPLAALDRTQSFVDAIRAESQLSVATGEIGGGGNALENPPSRALRREVEQVSTEAGRIVTRMTRLLFDLMTEPPPAAEPPEF
jgi:transcriptional regulator with XRE-family HTH domain